MLPVSISVSIFSASVLPIARELGEPTLLGELLHRERAVRAPCGAASR